MKIIYPKLDKMNKDVISVIGDYLPLAEACEVFKHLCPNENVATFSQTFMKRNLSNLYNNLKTKFDSSNILSNEYRLEEIIPLDESKEKNKSKFQPFIDFCCDNKAVLSGSFVLHAITNDEWKEGPNDLDIYLSRDVDMKKMEELFNITRIFPENLHDYELVKDIFHVSNF